MGTHTHAHTQKNRLPESHQGNLMLQFSWESTGPSPWMKLKGGVGKEEQVRGKDCERKEASALCIPPKNPPTSLCIPPSRQAAHERSCTPHKTASIFPM